MNEDNTLKKINNDNTNTIQTYESIDKILTNHEESSTCISRNKKLFLIIGIIVAILVIIGVVLLCVLKKDKEKQPENYDEPEIIDENIINPINPIQKDPNHIDVEFQFKTEVKDLRSVNVKQKYTERVLTNGDETTINVNRETNYEIFILSEQEPSEINKNNYNKLYTAAILIKNHCISINEENCDFIKMIDITNVNKENISNYLTYLDELSDFKDLSIPLCLVNITDNDVITSMKCPETLQTSIKKNMILDLYFFRPPAIKRPDKIGGNITINKWNEGDKYYIRELNGGICAITHSFNSLCTTDMNTTTDINGTILTYDEEAVTYITNDDKNSFYKNKITNLKDNSNELTNIDKISYEEVLTKMVSKLSPYMIYKEEFSDEEFKTLYNLSKNKTDKKDSQRNLNDDISNQSDEIVFNKSLMHIQHETFLDIKFELKNDIGYNVETMKAFSNIIFDDENYKEISNLQEHSKITEVLNKLVILSKSGNELLLDLYNKSTESFNKITPFVNNTVVHLIKNVVYKELSDIFDSTLSLENLMNLPNSILDESSSLNNKQFSLLNNISNGGMKNDIKILNTNIYDYIERSHILINNIFKNINNLTQALNSSRSKITEISTFFNNNTPSSLIGIYNDAEEIFMNYYKNEKNFVWQKVEVILNSFEKKINESLQKEERIIDKLHSKLENNQINLENGTEEDLINLKLDLINIKNNKSKIISKGKEKIQNELNLKDSDYFISNYDINVYNVSYTQSLEEGKSIANKLDHDDIIDKDFIKSMDSFKNNFTNILKYLDHIKEEKFPLIDDALNGSVFNEQVKKSFDLNSLGNEVVKEIKNENYQYLDDVNKIVLEFLDENKDEMDELYLKLTLLFNEDSLIELANEIEMEFDEIFRKIESDIEFNKKLSSDYLSIMARIMNDNAFFLDYFYQFNHDDPRYPYILRRYSGGHYVYLKNYVDSIKSKIIAQGYVSKYQKFKNNLMESKYYIQNELYSDLKNEYENQLNKIKESLNKIKRSSISDIYPDFSQLDFIENNINNLKDFFDKLNNHISSEKFNTIHYNKIEEFKNKEINEINNIDLNILEFNNNKIKTPTIKNDYQNDFCVSYERKRIYTCTNGVIYNYVTKYDDCYCLINETDYYQNLTKISTHCKPKFSLINKFYLELNTIIDSYVSKIEILKKRLLDLQNDALQNDNLSEKLGNIKNKVDTILNDFYGENLIINLYNNFKNNSNERLNEIYNNLENKWKNLFIDMKTDLETNLDNYKNTIYEFNFKAQIIQQLYINNISNTFYDSIISHQKMEFNYSISYYYNYLYKTINSTYQTILSKIPINKEGLDVILKSRENEVKAVFSEIIKNLLNSKKSTLNMENQIYILQIPETNFFETNSILVDSQINLNNSLTNITREISLLNNNKINDEYSLTLKYYLENSESAKQIKDFYEDINNQMFVYLNWEKFNETILKNWIFDQDDFIKKLNQTLYNSNIEIMKEFNLKKESYKSKLLEILSENFSKDEIVHKINDLFSTSYKNLPQTEINQINQNIQEIIEKIKENLDKEQQRIETYSTSYNKDFTKINKTINDYKNIIFSTINQTIFSVLEEIHNNINTKLYENYIENNLKLFKENVEKIIKNFEPSNLLNMTFNVKDIIVNIVNELSNNYKFISKTQINNKYNKFYQNIFNQFELDSIQNNINQQINQQFDIFYSSLVNVAKFEIGDEGYVSYDLSDEIKNEINNSLETNNNNINTIIQNTKGENFNFDEKKWKKLDFTRINLKLEEIKKSFNNFINQQSNKEQNELDEIIQKIIKLNFNNLINNLIPSFGNDFFERIIFYNENFKIESLYNNINWGLIDTISYYLILYNYNSIQTLTNDLKIKIYNLNNLEELIEIKKQKIFESLNITINEFNKKSINQIKNNYLSYFNNDTSISLAFNENIKQIIKKNIFLIMPEIEDNFNKLLNKYLKERMLDSYSKILNLKSEEIFVNVRDHKEFIKGKFDDLFSLDPDEILTEINNKLNKTKNAIKEYNDYFNTFQIHQDLLTYIENFGYDKIKPLYVNFLSFMNKITKNQIIEILKKMLKNMKIFTKMILF